MLKHIVMWKFKDEAEGHSKAENCRYVKEQLSQLPSLIPVIRSLEVGLNSVSGSMAWDMVLVTEFASKDDLDLYAMHPEHVKISDFVAKVRLERAVVDYETRT